MTTKKTVAKKEKSPKNLKVVEIASISLPKYATQEMLYSHIDDYNFKETMTEKVIYNQNQDMLTRTEYQGWLVSPDIWKRSIAVFGHTLLAQVAIFVIIGFFVLILG